MARRDLIQDTDRPHYYSQYWIDIATGKEKSATAVAEPAAQIDELYPFAADATEAPDISDEYIAPPVIEKPEPKAKTKAEPKKAEPAAPRSLTSLADLANIDLLMRSSAAMDDDVTPDIETGATPSLSDAIVTDFDLDAITDDAAAAPEAAATDDTEFDEDEEDDEWAARHKPKQPKAKRRERRDF